MLARLLVEAMGSARDHDLAAMVAVLHQLFEGHPWLPAPAGS
jgi:hypothetical protein